FDVKAEKQQLSNDQYKLKQLGNTDADLTQKGKLIEAINDSTDRIKDAETKLQDAGIDPKAADLLHRQRMAGQEFRKVLIKNKSPPKRPLKPHTSKMRMTASAIVILFSSVHLAFILPRKQPR